MKQIQEHTQSQIMAPAMQTALKYLQMPAAELRAESENAAMSNPFIAVEECCNVSFSEPSGHCAAPAGTAETDTEYLDKTRPESYTDYLYSQLGQNRLLDTKMLRLCRYIVGCLSRSGYLEVPLEEIAASLGLKYSDAEQALYAVQALDPPGTGARNAAECLLLQLAAGDHFNETNVHLVRFGLELLAQADYDKLAAVLGVSVTEAFQAAEAIRSLNPIPSSGFYTGESECCTVPEAEISVDGGGIFVQINRDYLPGIGICREYLPLVDHPMYTRQQEYLKRNLSAAKEMILSVEKRESTLKSILELIIRKQKNYFLSGAPIEPCTMSEAAAALGVSVSTVSRGIKDKYILFNKRCIPMKAFFSVPVSAANEKVTQGQIRIILKKLIKAENPENPLSDAELCLAFERAGITLSRRTVAKYRSMESIPPQSQRKRQSSAHMKNSR